MGKSEQGVRAGASRYAVIPRVLVFVFNRGDVLLLKGAPTKRIWANRYNGVGGHVEAHEDVYTAARREVREETGLVVRDLRLRGVVSIDVGEPVGIMMFVFSAHSAQRETIASREGALFWLSVGRLPEKDLVEDLPILLARISSMGDGTPPFFARYWYDQAGRLQIDFAG